jgi:hypothetical protein
MLVIASEWGGKAPGLLPPVRQDLELLVVVIGAVAKPAETVIASRCGEKASVPFTPIEQDPGSGD